MDVHVMSVWKQGITGKGVVVTILDDGQLYQKLNYHLNKLGWFLSIVGYFNQGSSVNQLGNNLRSRIEKILTSCAQTLQNEVLSTRKLCVFLLLSHFLNHHVHELHPLKKFT